MSICLFQNKVFTSAAGLPLTWKVECDALFASGNWEWAAARVAERCKFSRVRGIPTGGYAFEQACGQHITMPYGSEQYSTLIVDDVWTTGNSIRRYLQRHDWWDKASMRPIDMIRVWVLFSRTDDMPDWAHALWTFTADKRPDTFLADAPNHSK